MGYKYTGEGVLGISLNVNTPKPLDIRTVVNSTKDLYEIPKNTAYVGMTVANITDGNIYMLTDLANIDNKAGWRASYESILIISCTALEYTTWLNNTNIDGDIFSPKDEATPYIHANTYYYVEENTGLVDENDEFVEDSLEYYITRSWIENALKSKASTGTTDTLSSNITNLSNKLDSEYSTTIDILTNYYSKLETNSNFYTKDEVYTKSEVDDSFYKKEQVYNLSEIDDKFVTKASLRGGLEGDTDDFVFVTLLKYSEDQLAHDLEYESYKLGISAEISNCIKSNSDAILTSISASDGEFSTITSSSLNIESIINLGDINIQASSLLLNSKNLLTEDLIEKHEILTSQEYDSIVKDENTYYYVYDDSIKDGWVLKSTLNNYYTKQEVKELLDLFKTLLLAELNISES